MTPIYGPICSLVPRSIALKFDNETDNFNISVLELVSSNELNIENKVGGQYFTRSLRHGIGGHLGIQNNKIDIKEREILALPCSCAPDYFCLSSSATACALTNDKNEPVKCLYTSGRASFARNMMFPIIVLYLGLGLLLLFTKNGNKALKSALYRFCLRGRNRRLAEQISMQVEKYKKEKSMFKKELVLKIKRFESQSSIQAEDFSTDESSVSCTSSESMDLQPSHNSEKNSIADDNYSDNPTCSICICDINHNDKIGELSCEHLFHVDCLKVWLKRNNVCPLCMGPGVTNFRIKRIENDVKV